MIKVEPAASNIRKPPKTTTTLAVVFGSTNLTLTFVQIIDSRISTIPYRTSGFLPPVTFFEPNAFPPSHPDIEKARYNMTGAATNNATIAIIIETERAPFCGRRDTSKFKAKPIPIAASEAISHDSGFSHIVFDPKDTSRKPKDPFAPARRSDYFQLNSPLVERAALAVPLYKAITHL